MNARWCVVSTTLVLAGATAMPANAWGDFGQMNEAAYVVGVHQNQTECHIALRRPTYVPSNNVMAWWFHAKSEDICDQAEGTYYEARQVGVSAQDYRSRYVSTSTEGYRWP